MNKTEARELISKGFKSLTASSKSYQEKVHLDFIKDHETLINFFVSLEEDDDVQNVYSNAEFLK